MTEHLRLSGHAATKSLAHVQSTCQVNEPEDKRKWNAEMRDAAAARVKPVQLSQSAADIPSRVDQEPVDVCVDAMLVRTLDENGGMLKIGQLYVRTNWGSGPTASLGGLRKYLSSRLHLFSTYHGMVALKKNHSLLTRPLEENAASDGHVDVGMPKAANWKKHNNSYASSNVHEDSDSQCTPAPIFFGNATQTTPPPHSDVRGIDISKAEFSAGGTNEPAVAQSNGAVGRTLVPNLKRKFVETRKFTDWLIALDAGRGAMLQYLDALICEFDGDFLQLCAAWRGMGLGKSVLDSVDSAFWDAVGIHRIGHRLLFARGIEDLVNDRRK